MSASPDQQHVEQQQFEGMTRSALSNTKWNSAEFAHHVEQLLRKRAADGDTTRGTHDNQEDNQVNNTITVYNVNASCQWGCSWDDICTPRMTAEDWNAWVGT